MTTHPPLAKMNNRSVVKINRIHKHMKNFKTSSHSFCVDVINVWPPIGNNFLKKVMERLETSKFKPFISFCNIFFFFHLFHKRKYT